MERAGEGVGGRPGLLLTVTNDSHKTKAQKFCLYDKNVFNQRLNSWSFNVFMKDSDQNYNLDLTTVD